MPTLRISTDCTEFGHTFTPGQLTNVLSDRECSAMVLSGLAICTAGTLPAWGIGGDLWPITSVMALNPGAYPIPNANRRIYETRGIEILAYVDGLEKGIHVITVEGNHQAGQTLTARFPAKATSVQWFRNDVAIGGATNLSADGRSSVYVVQAADMVPGTSLTVRMVAAQLESTPLVALATPPSTAAPVFVGVPTNGVLLAFTQGAVTGSPAPTVTITATVNGVAVTLPFTPGPADIGQLLVLTQTVTNAAGSASVTASATISSGVIAPTILTAPVIGGSTAVGGTATLTPATFGGTAGTLTTQWFLNGVAIPAATGASYVLTAPGSLTVAQTMTNLEGAATATSAAVAIVAAVIAPTVITAPLITGVSGLTGTAVAYTPAVFGGSPSTVARQWALDGVDIPGAVGATYTPVAAGALTVRETATNAAGSISSTSAAIPITVPVDLRPKFGIGTATYSATPDASLAAMTVVPGSVSGGKAGTFTFTTPGLQYAWFATTNPGAVAFTDTSNSLIGGWSLNTSNVSGGSTWYWWRTNFPGVAPSGKTFAAA